jgi:xanthine dehydrogenase YagS FAD-binding subunit
MMEFSYARAVDAPGAIRLSGAAAGTNLVDLMRETVEQPDALIDVTGLSSDIEVRDDGSVLIGAAFLVHQIWRRL